MASPHASFHHLQHHVPSLEFPIILRRPSIAQGLHRHRQDWLWQDAGLCPSNDAAHQGPAASRTGRRPHRPAHGTDARAGAADQQGNKAQRGGLWQGGVTDAAALLEKGREGERIAPLGLQISDARLKGCCCIPLNLGPYSTSIPCASAPQEIKKFAKPLAVTCVAVFGGSGVANQISELKRGTEVIVCTPGRMIDLLVTSNGLFWGRDVRWFGRGIWVLSTINIMPFPPLTPQARSPTSGV